MAQQTAPARTPAPAPAKKDEAKPAEAAPANGGPEVTTAYPPVPGTTPKPTRAQLKAALDEIGKTDDEITRLTFIRNKAIQLMIDAGHDAQPVKLKGKNVTFRKRMPRNSDEGTAPNYYIEPFVMREVEDYSQG